MTGGSSGQGGRAEPTIQPFGDRALLVTLGQSIDPIVNARVHLLAAALRDRASDVLGAPVAAYASLLVPFDPALVGRQRAEQLVRDALQAIPELPLDDQRDDPPALEIPVRYGGDDGPDLSEVAARLGRSEREVIELHSGVDYRVYMLGFAPGFGYLGALPAELALPRRADPRTRVPAGSVAIAERQTAVYPSSTAGGWHLIGRTQLTLWDPGANPAARLQPGMRVRFVPV